MYIKPGEESLHVCRNIGDSWFCQNVNLSSINNGRTMGEQWENMRMFRLLMSALGAQQDSDLTLWNHFMNMLQLVWDRYSQGL